MTVWQLIAEDMRMWKHTGFLGEHRASSPLRTREALAMLWRYPGLRATVYYRLAHAASRRHVPLLPGILSRRCLIRYGLDIVPGIDIGPGLYIPHPVGTVITANRIGARCSIISAVTIGMRNVQEFPIIGDDVFIGTGARILGGVTVGDGAQIGANAVVVRDVPAGATAVGIPAHAARTGKARNEDTVIALPVSNGLAGESDLESTRYG